MEVLFPAGDAVPAAPEISESAPPPVPRTETGATVLLVDDEEVVRDVGRAMLDTLGYEVLLAANGKEGVEVFRRNREKISMVILDLMMPVMDGKKAFEEIRRIDPRARVIISTGFSGDEDVDNLKEMGASAILPKPYSYDTMTRVITLPENR
jgi:CheY-like chemotaxis protein